MLTDPVPRIRLGHLPTPIEELPRLARALGLQRLLVKRDDLTGLAGGGNKTRKLEFSVAEALRQQADTLVTLGALQSNHARQTAAAAARCGLRCVLVLGGRRPAAENGNLLLDRLLGAELVFCGDRAREEVAAEVVAGQREAGRRPYLIPLGASDEVGAAGFVAAMEELRDQARALAHQPECVVVATSSFGTQAGLCLGAAALGFRPRIVGISIDAEAREVQAGVADVARRTASRLGLDASVEPEQVVAFDRYLGRGYGVLGDAEREAISLAASQEGLLLDPVYTGRAMAGLIDLARRGDLGRSETVLFWHTGGTPALHAYARGLLAARPRGAGIARRTGRSSG